MKNIRKARSCWSHAIVKFQISLLSLSNWGKRSRIAWLIYSRGKKRAETFKSIQPVFPHRACDLGHSLRLFEWVLCCVFRPFAWEDEINFGWSTRIKCHKIFMLSTLAPNYRRYRFQFWLVLSIQYNDEKSFHNRIWKKCKLICISCVRLSRTGNSTFDFVPLHNWWTCFGR